MLDVLFKDFTYKFFNITVEFILEKTNKDQFGWYNEDDPRKHITIHLYNIKKSMIKFKSTEYYLYDKLEQTIIHELTHFFDYNFWKSWQYKDDQEHEHLATFTENFHKYIYAFNYLITQCVKDDKLFEHIIVETEDE